MTRPLTLTEIESLLARLPSGRPFGAAEAARLGVLHHRLLYLQRRGRLVHPVRGAWHVAELKDTLELRIAILRTIVPEDCVVTDRTAAWLWGAQSVLAPGDHEVVPRVSVFAPPGRRLRNELSTSGERHLLGNDVAVVDGLRVTTALRTACDVARLLHRDQALAVMDALSGLGRFGGEQLIEELDRFKGYRGIIQARVLAPLVDAAAQSPMESVLRLRWYDAGLPRPQCQVPVAGPYGVYYIDVGLAEERFGAEYDGAAHHGPDRVDHDRDRRRWISDVEGWRLLVARRDDVVGRQQRIDRDLRQAWQLHRTLTRR